MDIVDVWRSLFPGRSVHELRLLIVDYELTRFPCWAMPGARRLLRGLVGRGIRIGIVSNAQFYTPLYLAAILGKDPEALGFDPSLCLYSWQFGRAKPDTFLFDTAASRLSLLGIERRSTVMIGNDPRNDIDAASRAGFMTALVAAERPDNRHGAHGLQRPDVVLGRLDDLLSRA